MLQTLLKLSRILQSSLCPWFWPCQEAGHTGYLQKDQLNSCKHAGRGLPVSGDQNYVTPSIFVSRLGRIIGLTRNSLSNEISKLWSVSPAILPRVHPNCVHHSVSGVEDGRAIEIPIITIPKLSTLDGWEMWGAWPLWWRCRDANYPPTLPQGQSRQHWQGR